MARACFGFIEVIFGDSEHPSSLVEALLFVNDERRYVVLFHMIQVGFVWQCFKPIKTVTWVLDVGILGLGLSHF